jgi:G:T-mismatch repair DNA endonuclease (very short patch repair protein)
MRGKKITTNEFIKKSKLIHNNKYEYSKTDYKNAHTKVKIICPIHGEFSQKAYSHIEGIGCSKCGIEKISNLKRDTLKKFIFKSRKIHKNKYSYKNSIYINNDTKLSIICEKHGIFYQTPTNHLRGRGCFVCGIENNKSHQPSNIKEFISKANKIHKNKYDYTHSNYINSRNKVKIICFIHGEFWQTPSCHLLKQGCPKCQNIISKCEINFLDYLKIPDTKENRQVRILRKKVDGFDPKTNTIYEFLGDYWHGNPKKFNRYDVHPLRKIKYGKLYKETFNKFDKFKSLGYNVKYIWESDWKKWNKNPITQIPIIEYQI